MEWPLLASLSPSDRAQLVAKARRRTFARGVVVLHEGDPGDSLHLIASGRLAVHASTPAGDRTTLNILGPGDTFGELSLVHAEPSYRSATVTALEPSETLSLAASTFHALCQQNPQIERLLVTMLAARVEELSSRLVEALYVSLDHRVYRRLSELADLYADETAAAPVIPLTQDQLADLAGGTRPTVNQILQRLVAQDVIALSRGRIRVRDRDALRRKANIDR